jgi:hypothetical protein
MTSTQVAGLLLSDNPSLTDHGRAGELIFGPAIAALHMPIYPVSASTSSTWCGVAANYQTTLESGAACATSEYAAVTPFGRPMTPLVDPSFASSSFLAVNTPLVGRRGQRSWTHNVSFGASHAYNLTWLPALLTGHPFWVDSQMELAFGYFMISYIPAAYNSSETNAGSRSVQTGNLPYLYPTSGPRGKYIPMRLMGMTVPVLPNSPYKEAMKALWVANIAISEGEQGLQTGNYYVPCVDTVYTKSRWCFGRYRLGNTVITEAGMPLIGSIGGCSVSSTNTNRAFSENGAFQWAYPMAAARIAYNLGLPEMRPLGLHVGKAYAHVMMNQSAHSSSSSGWQLAKAYAWPAATRQPEGSDVSCTGQNYSTLGADNPQFTSVANWFEAMSPSDQDITKSFIDSGFYPNLPRDRQYIFEAGIGLIGTSGGYSTRRIWEASRRINIPANATFPARFGEMPNYLWSPDWWHKFQEISVYPSSASAVVTFRRPEKAVSCSYLAATSPITDPSDSGDASAGTIGRLRHSFTITGLTSGTLYYLRLTCKSADSGYVGRRYMTFTTE